MGAQCAPLRGIPSRSPAARFYAGKTRRLAQGERAFLLRPPRTVLILELIDADPLASSARIAYGLDGESGGALLLLRRSGLGGREQAGHARPLTDRAHLALRRAEAGHAPLAVLDVRREHVDALPFL